MTDPIQAPADQTGLSTEDRRLNYAPNDSFSFGFPASYDIGDKR